MKFLRIIFFNIMQFFLLPIGKRAVILMYHSVSSQNTATFTVSEKEFEKQIKYLVKKKFIFITISELVDRLKNNKDISNCCVITFDDGYVDNIKNALPVLNKYNIKPTIFVVTSLLGKDMINSEQISIPILSVEDVLGYKNYIEFMPHTASHKELSTVTFDVAIKDIDESRIFLEKNLKCLSFVLAYPRGKYNIKIVDYLIKNNWNGAVTVSGGLVHKNSNVFELKRNAVLNATSFAEFKFNVSGWSDVFNQIKKWIR